jgi:rhodanese-related sulfurtransferase
MEQLVDDGRSSGADHQGTMQTPTPNQGEAMALTLADMIAGARSQAREIAPADAAKAHNDAELNLIIDVREPGEYDEGHVPDAINSPRGVLELRADPASPAADATLAADRSARVLVYCTKGPGARSLLAAQTLASMGYDRVEVLAGGLIAWAEAGLPVEPERHSTTV